MGICDILCKRCAHTLCEAVYNSARTVDGYAGVLQQIVKQPRNMGFKMNPCDPCVTNMMVDRGQII